MNSKSKVPQIRFRGFSGEWEEKELGSVCTFFSGGTPTSSNKSYYEGSIPFIGSGKISDESVEQFITEEALKNSSAKLVKKGDLLYALYGATSGEVAISKIDGAINQTVLCIRNQEETYFLLQWLLLNKKSILSTYLQGGQGNLSAQIIKSLTHHIPLKLEQTKIGDYFQQLDKLIEQKEKKYEKLKQFKKAMLSKMFPKNGADIPEIRFKGFSGKWEEKKLGNIFNYERPDNYIVKSTEYSNDNKTPVLTANKAFILGYTNELNTFNKPSIIFDDFTLDFKFVDFPYMVKSSALKILTISDERKDSLIFIYNLLHTIKIEIMGHARHYIGVVQPTNVFVPKIEEQIKIGNYFQKLDNQIDLQLQEIEKLKNIKKASLAKMFV